MTDRLSYGAVEDRTMPAVVYALYLLAPTNGLTAVIGVIIAHMQQGGAGSRMRTHYQFLIRTFWLTIAWCVAGGLIMAIALPLMLVLIGFPLMFLGGLIMGAAGIWFFVRAVVGVIYLARDEPYPRPYALVL